MHEEQGWKRRERKKGGASFYRVLLNFGNFVYLSDFAPFLKPCIIVRVQKNKDKDIAIEEKQKKKRRKERKKEMLSIKIALWTDRLTEELR